MLELYSNLPAVATSCEGTECRRGQKCPERAVRAVHAKLNFLKHEEHEGSQKTKEVKAENVWPL